MKDLRTFLKAYEECFPKDILKSEELIDSNFEVTALAKHLEEKNRYPIMLFDKVKGPKGSVSRFRFVTNVLGDRRKMAFAIDSTFENVAIDWRQKVDQGGLAPEQLRREDAPCKENVVLGDKIDLLELPILHHHEMDPGPYITSGLFTCYEPDSKIENTAFHRGFVVGPREIRCYLSPRTHAYYNLMAHWNAEQPMKVAYWVGHHPAVLMGAQTRMAYPQSHYLSAGAVAGEPLRVVPSETLGDDFLVPADAEFVIEGIMRPGNRGLEGPFGEYPRYYGPQQMSPIFEVTALTYRNEAIWNSLMVGINNNYGGTQEEGTIYNTVKKVVPQVQRVFVPVSGAGRFHAYIQLRKTHDGQPKEAIMAALSSSEWIKHVIVVDEDIDIYDDRWVLWAVATRSQWDRDLVVVPGCLGSHLDPSVNRNAISTKGGIDATKPAPPTRFPLKLNVPREVMQKIKPEDIFGEEAIASLPGSRD